MTDKLHSGAPALANHQPTTTMPNKFFQALQLLLSFGLFCGAGHQAVAQLLVQPAGSGVQAFGALPTVAQGWSTALIGGGSGDFATAGNLDNHVITNTAISAVTAALGSSGTVPPSQQNIARWNSSGLYVQTRPTGNAYLLLLATMQNNTGSNITHVTVEYDWDQKHAMSVTEEVPGQRAFYSLTGTPNSWTLIPQFSTFTVTSTAQHLAATLALGNWTNGARLYLAWADDNGSAAADGGNVANQEGSYTIDNFLVSAVPATVPVITQHPQPQSVAPGGAVSLNVTAIGASPLTFYWRLNSNVISTGSSPTYTINNAALIHQGFYSVIVSNGFGAVTSSNAFITVACASAVAVATQPVDQAMGSGNTLALGVGVSGTAPVSYQWYRNDAPLAGATNATYAKANAQPADSGLYRVVANNCAGVPASSSNAVVSVTDAPINLIGLTNYSWKYEWSPAQTGTDLGASWRATNYDDSAWPAGRGLFALENLAALNPLTNTILRLTNAPGVNIPTHYFRTHFTFTNDRALVKLVSTNYIDDGAVFYLNGTEIFRVNMNEGNVTYDTLATTDGPVPEGTFYVTNLPMDNLVIGDNVLAVEVHQNSPTSSDIAFGMALAAVYLPSSQLLITNQPQGVVVEETKEVRLTLGLQGQPAYFQWYRNGVAVSNGTSNPLVFPIATTNDTGSYFVIATNAINSVTSSLVNVTVYRDTNAPVLVEADGTLFMTNVLVSFSERITTATGTNISNYQITNTITGTALTILRATILDGTNVSLYTSARTAGQNYILVVNNLRDVSPQTNLIAANSAFPVRSLMPVIAMNGAWRFYDPFPPFDEPNLGTAWKEFTYNEAPNFWGDGFGVFYDGANVSDVPSSINTALSQTDSITSYFRGAFNLQASPGGLRLLLTRIVDDGAIFYLNGLEVLRANLPAGPVNYQTPASTAVGSIPRVGPINLPPTALRQGANVLAAELHQLVAIDVDKAFGAQLDASVQSFAIGPVVITGGPQDLTVVEGSTATFTLVQAGGATFRWQQNSNSILDATNDTYSIPNVPLSLNGARFRVAVSNTTPSGAISTNATLRVIPDTNGPQLFAAYASPNSIIVTFNEAVTAVTANNTANYAVTNSAGQSFAISGAALSNGTNVTLSFASLPPGTYSVVVNNVKDTSVLGSTIAPNSVVRAGFAGQVVAIAASWRYDSSGLDRGAAVVWGAVAYNDAAWTGNGQGVFAAERGVAPNGAGGNYPVLPEPVRTSLNLSNGSGQLPSYYFRTHFNSYSSGAGTLTFRTILDDGAVIYLNGLEVFRLGIANNVAPGYNTLANRTVGDASYEGPFTVSVTNVLSGDNVIAVSVHQNALDSGDIEWAGDFSLNVPPVVRPTAPIVVPGCSNITWSLPVLKHQSVGTNLMLSWTNPVTNSCGSNLVFTLQQSLALSNGPGTTPWSNVTTVSPFQTPKTNVTRFFRLQR